mmetsp:Transcript_31438/g.36245  ORF Transcript_31438/g.36245 Transcript_31438/m.36245 type:complete len:210 (-) Transcript_31438:885-1514(-)
MRMYTVTPKSLALILLALSPSLGLREAPFVNSRRQVLSGAVASAGAGALWRSEASADPLEIGSIGEPVISGGPLPLTVGLGTGPPYAQKYVELAIDAGYRLFDTAQEYGSETGIGNALKAAFVAGKLKRKDVFVTTKVEIDNMGYEPTIQSVRESLENLGNLEGGIDLVLIHWPCPFVPKYEPGCHCQIVKATETDLGSPRTAAAGRRF